VRNRFADVLSVAEERFSKLGCCPMFSAWINSQNSRMRTIAVCLAVFAVQMVAAAPIAQCPADSAKFEEAVTTIRNKPRVGDLKLCSTCETVVKTLNYVLSSKPLTNVTRGLLDDACAKQHSFPADVCDAVVTIVLYLGKRFLVEVPKGSDWNTTQSVACSLIGACEMNCCSSNYAPEQLQLSFASRQVVATAVDYRIQWVTLLTTAAGGCAEWRVAGTDAWEMSALAAERTYTYGGWRGVTHAAVMTNLSDATTYEYRVGCATHGFSAAYNFTTLPLNAGSPGRPLRVLTIADMGNDNSKLTIAAMAQRVAAGKVDFVLHTGDISYADSDESHWDEFCRSIQPIAAHVPYMTVPGNHESPWNFTAYRTRMWMPQPGDGAPADGMYHAFEAGPVAFVNLDDNTPWAGVHVSPVQQRWLKQQLVAANAKRQLIFTAQHHPLYCSNNGRDCGSEAKQMRSWLEESFVQHGVALNLCGHMHSYERTLPTYHDEVASRNYSNSHAPAYLINGAAGSREGYSGFRNAKVVKPWSVVRETIFGYVDLEIAVTAEGNATVTSTFRRSTNHSIVDQFAILKTV
jgi:hypothetical protein